MLRPRGNARGETRTLTVHVLSMPPLPVWATRALDARGGSRTRTETLFERATSAVWVTRALRVVDEYGRRDSNPQEPPSEDGVSAFAPLPRAMLEEGLEPSVEP